VTFLLGITWGRWINEIAIRSVVAGLKAAQAPQITTLTAPRPPQQRLRNDGLRRTSKSDGLVPPKVTISKSLRSDSTAAGMQGDGGF